MDPESQEKTAFTTPGGLTVMPFWLCNAPATFQRLMEGVLSGLAREQRLDDVLVYGTDCGPRCKKSTLAYAGLKLKRHLMRK
jgi:hypothetical protein